MPARSTRALRAEPPLRPLRTAASPACTVASGASSVPAAASEPFAASTKIAVPAAGSGYEGGGSGTGVGRSTPHDACSSSASKTSTILLAARAGCAFSAYSYASMRISHSVVFFTPPSSSCARTAAASAASRFPVAGRSVSRPPTRAVAARTVAHIGAT